MSTEPDMDQIRIVLVRPSHPGNIGAAARAMKNMGLKQLVLVAPEAFPSDVATARASGAEDVLINAPICDRLEHAISDCHHVVTTTARNRSLQWDNVDARKAANQVIRQSRQGQVAVVFGPERTGLSNQEIELSHQLVHIPVNDDFSSMNLAAAVMLMCYELRMAFIDEPESYISESEIEKKATSGQVEGFIQHLHEIMAQIGFLTNKPSDRLMGRIRRLYNRSHMSEQDVNIMRGILAGIQSRIKR